MGPDLAYTPDPYGVLGDWRGAAQIAHERLPGAPSDSSTAHFFDFPPSGREKSVSLRRFLRENQIIASKGYGARVRVSVNFP